MPRWRRFHTHPLPLMICNIKIENKCVIHWLHVDSLTSKQHKIVPCCTYTKIATWRLHWWWMQGICTDRKGMRTSLISLALLLITMSNSPFLPLLKFKVVSIFQNSPHIWYPNAFWTNRTPHKRRNSTNKIHMHNQMIVPTTCLLYAPFHLKLLHVAFKNPYDMAQQLSKTTMHVLHT